SLVRVSRSSGASIPVRITAPSCPITAITSEIGAVAGSVRSSTIGDPVCGPNAFCRLARLLSNMLVLQLAMWVVQSAYPSPRYEKLMIDVEPLPTKRFEVDIGEAEATFYATHGYLAVE